MPRTKLAVTGSVTAAAGLVGAVVFSGPAYAGTSATASYDCVTSQSPPVTYTGVGSTAIPSGTRWMPKLSIFTTWPAPVDIPQDTLPATIRTSAGEFTGIRNPELYGPLPPDPGDPVTVGPLGFTGATPLASATLPNGSGPPTSTNWQLRLYLVVPGVYLYCVRTANSGTITWP